MYCPQCGLEYRDGVTVCTDCGVALTENPPAVPHDEAEWRALETVLESSDPARLAATRSLLEAAGIPCFSQGEMIQDLMGLGRVSGTNLVAGPVRLEVPAERSAEARELLSAADAGALEIPADVSPDDDSSAGGSLA